MCRRILDSGSLSKALGRKANFSQWREILDQWDLYWKKQPAECEEREKSLSHELQQREIKFFEVEYLSKYYCIKFP